MGNLEMIGLLGLIFGSLGTMIGGAIGSFLEIKSAKILGFILEFAARTYDINHLLRLNTKIA